MDRCQSQHCGEAGLHHPVTSDPVGNLRSPPLMPMECDSGAQRSFFRTFEFDSCGSKQVGPSLMESDWCDLVRRLPTQKKTKKQKKGSCQKRGHFFAIIRHAPECATFKKTPAGCQFGDKCVYKHTATSADEKNKLSNSYNLRPSK